MIQMLKLSRFSSGLLVPLIRSRPGAASFCTFFEDGESSHASVRRPLGDQKTIYHQHQRHEQRSSRENSFERRQFNGFSRPGVHSHGSGGFGGGRGGQFGKDGVGQKLQTIDWSLEDLAPIKKNFYEEQSVVSSRDQFEIDEWITKNQVTLEGRDIPRAVFEFNEAGFSKSMVDRLEGEFQKPTVIQSISWPLAMSGRDVISIGKTGSGKTLGFMLPGILHTVQQKKRGLGEGPSVVVLLPTRELAQQVEGVAREYCKEMNMSIACVFGGAARGPQARDLSNGVDVIIATPGRLLDFMDNGTTNLRRCTYLVLDEADRMLDMGFEPQMRKIVSQTRPDRQTLMFSATWPKEVRTLAADFQKDAAFLNVGSMELSANHNITQKIEIVEEDEKSTRLTELLRDIMAKDKQKTLIFVQTKRKADFLTRKLRHDGFAALSIHGDKSQSERDWVLNEFKSGSTQILLATDVAARGLDVNDIKFVINCDYPNNSEDYVHRIGRTGRRDQKGVAYSFFTSADAPKAGDLVKVLEEAKQDVPPELAQMMYQKHQGGKSFGNRRNEFSGGFRNTRSFKGGYGGERRNRFDDDFGGSNSWGGFKVRTGSSGRW